MGGTQWMKDKMMEKKRKGGWEKKTERDQKWKIKGISTENRRERARENF